jgi:2-methylcitrate dehydratase
MALVEKTSVKPGESLIAKLPKWRGASVEIIFADGQSCRETVEIPEGDAERPLSRSSLEHKFLNFAVPVVSKAGCGAGHVTRRWSDVGSADSVVYDCSM